MKCPKCGAGVRPSKKYPGYYLCDNCKKRYHASSVIKDEPRSTSTGNKRKKKKKNPFLLVLILLFLIGLLAICLYYSGIIKFEETDTPQKELIDSYVFGNAASLNDIDFEVISVNTAPENDLIKPSSEKSFLLIEAKIVNNSDSNVNINAVSNFELYAEDELISYTAHAYEVLADEQPRLGGAIAPGQSISGYLCYEVPADWTSVKLQFSSPVWSLHKAQFELNNQ